MKHFFGIANDTALFLEKEFLCDKELWKSFADVYRIQPDGENGGWRGEYWGKMMRGACLVYEYTRDDTLYNTLTDTICDILTVGEEDGRVSSYSRDTEFTGWDIWSRKYIILGCEYYLDICKDEGLKNKVIDFISKCADYILLHIGKGKKDITKASRNWRGINSSSILEPMVKLYGLTNEKRYLDFAGYIVENGGASGINIFELAYENKLLPYQYGVSKAYELTSCFEGLLEYYYATGIEKYKTAVINYAEAVLSSEMSIIGSSGMTHELFDHTSARQTVKYDGVIQETCVTVTLMKFFSRMLELTKESKYADAMEISFYNAYLGALNTEKREARFVYKLFPDKEIKKCILPFDSYCPSTAGKRGEVTGGLQLLPDGGYYGCCACIGAAGVGVFLKNSVTLDEEGITVNFYEKGKVSLVYKDVPVTFEFETDYPLSGKVKLHVTAEKPISFALRLRAPAWAKREETYTEYIKIWHDDTVEFEFDMPIEIHYPLHWEEDVIYTNLTWQEETSSTAPVKVYHKDEDDLYFAVTKGPITLAADSRTGKSADSVFDLPVHADSSENEIADGIPCMMKMKMVSEKGDEYYLVDYAHAGRDWETVIAAWLKYDN